MSYPIPDGSPWKAAAVRVGAEIRRALEARSVGWRELNAALGKDVHTIVDHYKAGRNLPRLGQAALLAEALAWPRIVELVRDARTFVCPIDGRTFVCNTGHRQKYCSGRCRDVDAGERARLSGYEQAERRAYAAEDPERVLVARLKQELERTRQAEAQHGGKGGYVHRREIRDAIKQWERTSSQSRHRRTKNQLNEHLAAVEAMCAACEPEGICRTAECPLRGVSPLPYIAMADVALAARQRTRQEIWADNPQRAINQSASMRARYQAEPERRQAQRERSRAWWAGLTPAERVETGRRIAAARRGKPSVRACGCPNRKHLDGCALAHAGRLGE